MFVFYFEVREYLSFSFFSGVAYFGRRSVFFFCRGRRVFSFVGFVVFVLVIRVRGSSKVVIGVALVDEFGRVLI